MSNRRIFYIISGTWRSYLVSVASWPLGPYERCTRTTSSLRNTFRHMGHLDSPVKMSSFKRSRHSSQRQTWKQPGTRNTEGASTHAQQIPTAAGGGAAGESGAAVGSGSGGDSGAVGVLKPTPLPPDMPPLDEPTPNMPPMPLPPGMLLLDDQPDTLQ